MLFIDYGLVDLLHLRIKRFGLLNLGNLLLHLLILLVDLGDLRILVSTLLSEIYLSRRQLQVRILVNILVLRSKLLLVLRNKRFIVLRNKRFKGLGCKLLLVDRREVGLVGIVGHLVLVGLLHQVLLQLFWINVDVLNRDSFQLHPHLAHFRGRSVMLGHASV